MICFGYRTILNISMFKSFSITWELISNAHPKVSLQTFWVRHWLEASSLGFNKVFQWLRCLWRLENHCSVQNPKRWVGDSGQEACGLKGSPQFPPVSKSSFSIWQQRRDAPCREGRVLSWLPPTEKRKEDGPVRYIPTQGTSTTHGGWESHSLLAPCALEHDPISVRESQQAN